MLLRFQKAAGRGNYETGNQAFSKCLRFLTIRGAKGLPPISPAPPIPPEPASASLRTISLDDSEYLLHNHHASVASLRLMFAFAPERRSASFRNRCSPSPEYPG